MIGVRIPVVLIISLSILAQTEQRAGHQDRLDPECGQYQSGVFEAKVLHGLDQGPVIFMKGSMQSKEEAHHRSLEDTEAEGTQTFLSTANSMRPDLGQLWQPATLAASAFLFGPFPLAQPTRFTKLQ